MQIHCGKAFPSSWRLVFLHSLQAYYDEIHPFQPLLPAQKRKEWIAQRLMRDSPFLLACRAILALCPNPADPAPRSLASRALRRSHAAALAREAQDRIDELLNEAGEDDDRQPSIECVQALSLLGLYEFGQTGNAQKNRLKLGQALQLAMELGLHEIDRRARSASANQQGEEVIVPERSVHVEGEDDMKDMQRRTWWVLYAGYLISGLIAGKVSTDSGSGASVCSKTRFAARHSRTRRLAHSDQLSRVKLRGQGKSAQHRRPT